MSAVGIIRTKLAAYSALTAVVPATKIMAGDLPLNTVLPAIGVTQISSIPRTVVAMPGTNVLHTSRVQVTVLFKATDATPDGTGYPGLDAAMDLVLAACPHARGTVAGLKVDSIIPDIEGPDLSNPDIGVVSRSRDFIVTWSA